MRSLTEIGMSIISDLTIIGKINAKLLMTISSEYKHISKKLEYVFLIFTDHRVRYGKIEISKVIAADRFEINIPDLDLLDEISKEKSVQIALDEEEIIKIDENSQYFNPIGMKVVWNNDVVGTIIDHFYNGAHDVYEIELQDKKTILIPDVEDFVIETNTDEHFIRVVNLDQFINL